MNFGYGARVDNAETDRYLYIPKPQTEFGPETSQKNSLSSATFQTGNSQFHLARNTNKG